MVLNFDNKIPEWQNKGVEPSTELKENGFRGGYKPPATVFNWFWSLVQKCITELQTKLKIHADSTNNPHCVTKEQVGLSNVDNTADSNKNVLSATKLTTARKINGTTFDGTADITVPATPTFTALVSKDLNTVTAQGFYGGGANNSCTNLPTEVSTFMLIVSKNTSGTGYTQLLVDTATQKMYVRNYYNQKWQDWIGISTDGHTHSNTEITGLGNCATKNLAITVAQGNTNPVTSNAVYSALENIKNNGLNVIVATYDTPYDLKSKADYICTKDNASTVLQTALNTLKKGGTLELLQGTYTLQYLAGSLTFPAEGITIKGQGFSTSIQQPVNVEAGEALPIFNITKSNIKIKDVMLCDSIVSSPQSIVSQSAEGVTYDNIFFIYTAISNSIEVDNACIKGIGSCKFTRIQNCRVFKQASNNNKIMFDFGECTNFSGVIGGNINSGSDNISVKFAENNHKNATAIYGHTAIDITINN